jgi:hypothetical protein
MSTTARAHPAQPDPGDPADLADLDALADALNQAGFPALRLTPPGGLPYVDTGLPNGMAPGERIYAQAGTFFWHTATPIAPSDRPATAAAAISRALQTGTPQS